MARAGSCSGPMRADFTLRQIAARRTPATVQTKALRVARRRHHVDLMVWSAASPAPYPRPPAARRASCPRLPSHYHRCRTVGCYLLTRPRQRSPTSTFSVRSRDAARRAHKDAAWVRDAERARARPAGERRAGMASRGKKTRKVAFHRQVGVLNQQAIFARARRPARRRYGNWLDVHGSSSTGRTWTTGFEQPISACTRCGIL